MNSDQEPRAIAPHEVARRLCCYSTGPMKLPPLQAAQIRVDCLREWYVITPSHHRALIGLLDDLRQTDLDQPATMDELLYRLTHFLATSDEEFTTRELLYLREVL